MARIFVAGLINVETCVPVGGFPIHYEPVTFVFGGITTTVSGVGYNLARSFTLLGDDVRFGSLIASDQLSVLVREQCRNDAIALDWMQPLLNDTPCSCIMVAPDGQRRITTDLKNIQDVRYPVEAGMTALQNCDLAVLGNINFARPLIQIAKQRNIPIATDVHVMTDLHNDYNREWLTQCAILFQSGEQLAESPAERVRNLLNAYPQLQIVVVSLGDHGCWLGQRRTNTIRHVPAITIRPVVNTIGAGDALFSSFLHFYVEHGNADLAIEQARLCAAYKIGTSGGAQGLISIAEFHDVWRNYQNIEHRT